MHAQRGLPINASLSAPPHTGDGPTRPQFHTTATPPPPHCPQVGRRVTYIPSPTSKAEYRVELFTPSYVFRVAERPRIRVTSNSVMNYGQPFLIGVRGRGLGNGTAGVGASRSLFEGIVMGRW